MVLIQVLEDSLFELFSVLLRIILWYVNTDIALSIQKKDKKINAAFGVAAFLINGETCSLTGVEQS